MDKRQVRAFEGFAAESGAGLLRLATLLTSDPHTAEDVYQETLQRLAARWSRVENPKAFCRQVMLNIGPRAPSPTCEPIPGWPASSPPLIAPRERGTSAADRRRHRP